MKTEVSLRYTQQAPSSSYTEPDESNPEPNIISLRSVLILFFHLRLGL
jgi:hypothetical protein